MPKLLMVVKIWAWPAAMESASVRTAQRSEDIPARSNRESGSVRQLLRTRMSALRQQPGAVYLICWFMDWLSFPTVRFREGDFARPETRRDLAGKGANYFF